MRKKNEKKKKIGGKEYNVIKNGVSNYSNRPVVGSQLRMHDKMRDNFF